MVLALAMKKVLQEPVPHEGILFQRELPLLAQMRQQVPELEELVVKLP